MTVYNFQGLNLAQVDSPDDVRLYLYIFDVEAGKVFKQPAQFQIFSSGKLVHDTGLINPEQENIFVIQRKIENQNDLKINVEFKGQKGEVVSLGIPFQITESFFQQYGLYLAITLFFALVGSIKMISEKWKKKEKESARGGILAEQA